MIDYTAFGTVDTTAASALQRFEDALIAHGCRHSGASGWQCPVAENHSNGDANPSLSVSQGRKGAVVRCQAGCDTRDIAAAIGLTMADLFDEARNETRRQVAEYRYVDEHGELLYVKVRYEPKDFRVKRPAGSGWEWKLGDTRRVLYRLPEVIKAVSNGETVYVTEGEKDADRLMSLGLTATTNYEGAARTGTAKWRPEYGDVLDGADIVVIADRDEAGYAHAEAVAKDLSGKASSVRVMQPRVDFPRADVSDHLNADYTIDQLMPVLTVVPDTDDAIKLISLADLVANETAEPVFFCGMLYQGGLHSIAGAPDCGKTTIALDWALQLMKDAMTVIFLDEEGGPEIVAEKLRALGATREDMAYLAYAPFPARQWTDKDVARLMELVCDKKPVLMLCDSSAAFLARAGLDENQAPDVTNWWARVLTPVARDYRTAVLVIDHDTKNTEQSRYARGSGAKLAAVDVAFKVQMKQPFTRDQDGLLNVEVTKDRRGWLHREWHVDVRTGDGRITPEWAKGEVTDAAGDDWPPARRKVYEALTGEPQSGKELGDSIAALHGCGLHAETIKRELAELLSAGRADRIDNGAGRPAGWFRAVD